MNFPLLCRPVSGIDATAAFGPHLAAEIAALKALRDRGILVSAYTLDGPGAALFVDVASAADADDVAAELPLNVAGLLDVEIIALQPIL